MNALRADTHADVIDKEPSLVISFIEPSLAQQGSAVVYNKFPYKDIVLLT